MKSILKNFLRLRARQLEHIGLVVRRKPPQIIPDDLPDPELYQPPEYEDMVRLYRPWKDPAFIRKVSPEVLANTMLSLRKLYYMSQFVEHSLNLPGDFFEAGTGSGGSTLFMGQRLKQAKIPKLLWTLDTFAGYEGINPAKDPKYMHRGDIRCASVEQVRILLTEIIDAVRIVAGTIPSTLEEVKTTQISFAYIDVNLYDPTYAATRFCLERLVPGGIILFDDYSWPQTYGVREAIDRACAETGQRVICIPESLQAFLLSPV